MTEDEMTDDVEQPQPTPDPEPDPELEPPVREIKTGDSAQAQED